ncbi:MAG TPA: polyphenol oxidase family protein [Candidatus Binatia bacterium]|nr:polyphenol oxidase family protein [Candidatus Binatia bacterium]
MLAPERWSTFDGLVCGFGDRETSAPPSTLLLRRQVHGDAVVDAAVTATDDRIHHDGFARLAADADAAIVAAAGLIAGVRTADCVPVLLVAPKRHWAAAVHAGWRGTMAEIVVRAVEIAAGAGVAAESLEAALGPSIGPCCYEVSEELGDRFAAAGHAVVTRAGSQPRLDLRAINARLLERAGVNPASIQFYGPCTRCACDRYHSFRADPQSQGRQISWIGWQDRKQPPDR